MTEIDPNTSFRGLPLTPEQDTEILHYITVKKRHGAAWDTPELSAMLKDMLEPPSEDEQEPSLNMNSAAIAAERAAIFVDDAMEPIEASEEFNAAMELEAMKIQGL